MSLRDELLTPFRDIGSAGRALVTGSAVICQCAAQVLRRAARAAWAAAWRGPTLQDRLESAGAVALGVAMGTAGLVVGGRVAAGFVLPYAPVIGWTVGGVWVVVAWTVAPMAKPTAPDTPTKIIPTGAEAPPPAPEDAPPAPDADPLDPGTVARAVREIALPHGWRGAHLDDVLDRLPGHSREELLEVLAAAGIPVEEQLKLRLPGGRQRNRQGIRLTALPAGLGEALAGPSQAGAQEAVEARPEGSAPPVPLTVHGAE